MRYNDFTEFPVWKKAFELVILIYKATKDYPVDERFILVSDMRRAVNSITHNIAEGYGRYEARDKSRFYKFSRGSCYEIHSQTLVSRALEYIEEDKSTTIINNAKSIIEELDALIKSIENPNK